MLGDDMSAASDSGLRDVSLNTKLILMMVSLLVISSSIVFMVNVYIFQMLISIIRY
jgi:hypothetical protein